MGEGAHCIEVWKMAILCLYVYLQSLLREREEESEPCMCVLTTLEGEEKDLKAAQIWECVSSSR